MLLLGAFNWHWHFICSKFSFYVRSFVHRFAANIKLSEKSHPNLIYLLPLNLPFHYRFKRVYAFYPFTNDYLRQVGLKGSVYIQAATSTDDVT